MLKEIQSDFDYNIKKFLFITLSDRKSSILDFKIPLGRLQQVFPNHRASKPSAGASWILQSDSSPKLLFRYHKI